MVIFGAGVVTGGLLVHHALARGPRASHPAGPARPALAFSPGGLRLEFLRRAQRELDLTPDQRERIDKIIKEGQDHTRRMSEPILQRTKAQFMEALTPEQRARFEELVQQQQLRLREQHRLAPPREHPTNAPPPPPG